jgi:DNA-binding LacI/PurR family transcriptional regulator/GAF domain-containing protein
MSRKKHTTTDKGKTHTTIGLLMTNFAREFHRAAWSGIADAALERDVNLICFDGGILRALEGFDAQGNVLYDLVSAERIDGLIIWTSILDWAVEPEEMEAFCKRYHPLPTVSVGRMVEGVPSVLVDNYQGMHEAVSHLVEVHGYRRVAFLRGPKGSEEEELRYRAYADVLAEHDISIDPNLVTPYSGWERADGRLMTRLLLDERKVDFEAIVAANDSLALGALEELRARGLRSPQGVAVTGFDDVEETRATVLSLTTVRQPLDEVGRQAVESVLAMVQGEQVPEQVTVPLQLMVRRSCGCQSPAVAEAAAGLKRRSASSKSWVTALTAERASVLSDMVQAAGMHPGGVVPTDEVERILDSFNAEMKGQSPGAFIAEWEDVLRRVAMAGGNVSVWEGVLSALRRRALFCLKDKPLSQAEDLWHQARVLVEETAVQARTYAGLQSRQRDQVLREIDQILITSPGIEELTSVITQELPRLGIPSCYLSLYEDPGKPAEWAGLALAYDEKGRAELQKGKQRFRSSQLVPEGMLPQERQYNLMVEPLYFRENQLGFALFKVGQRDVSIYDVLRGQISGALQGALLLQERERAEEALEHRTAQLQTAAEVSRAASSILDLDELMLTVVDLIRERFDLYYAGLFLVDEAGRWAVLRAGTGEAGQKMLKQGHKLEVGGSSMIGWCVANKQARIALDVGEEAVRFENPLLPDTRSELALPLVSRGEAIGALTIQSIQEAAFSDEDIAVLQTMADQLTTAIANARLFEQTQAALAEMELIQRRYLAQAWAEFARTAEVSGYEQRAAGITPLGDELLPEVQQTIAEQRPVIGGGGDGTGPSVLVVPIMLRDQPIGALGFKTEGEKREWSAEDIALAEAIGEQFALAAENLRLLNETQRRATRERLTGEITARVRETLDLERVLKTATDEIYQALGLERVMVRLKMAEDGVERESPTAGNGELAAPQEEAA